MRKNLCSIFVYIAVNLNFLFPQTVNKVLITGEAGFEQHDTLVANAFRLGYSSFNSTPFPGIINHYTNDVTNSFIYASANNYELIVRSYEGLSDAITIAADYPSVKLVMPAGSNSFEEIFPGDVINSPVIITGAGVDSNVTGYQLEFFSIDPITTDTLSSFANGYIAGQISFIANTRGCSIEQARSLARSTGSENGTFNYYNGFGSINVSSALLAPLPVELVSFTAKLKNDFVLVEWETATELNNYGFSIERSSSSRVSDGQALGTKWVIIGFLDGSGNSNSPKHYSFIDRDIQEAGIYNYRLKQIDNDGKFKYSNVVSLEISIPAKYYLSQNYPNPFNPETKIDFTIPERQIVMLRVYNTLGEEVAELLNEEKDAGSYSVAFDGLNLSGGIYFYQLKTNQFYENKKMVLLK